MRSAWSAIADAIVSIEYYMETIQSGRADPWYMLDNAETCINALLEEGPSRLPTLELGPPNRRRGAIQVAMPATPTEVLPMLQTEVLPVLRTEVLPVLRTEVLSRFRLRPPPRKCCTPCRPRPRIRRRSCCLQLRSPSPRSIRR